MTGFSHISLLDDVGRERLDAFARMLIEANRSLNLTAIDDLEMVRARHFEDALAALPLLRRVEAEALERGVAADTLSLIDVGSGAGLPGLALAIGAPRWRVTSLEATGKKVDFQRSVVEALGLDNVEILQGRAETLAHKRSLRERFLVATIRAVAPLAAAAEITLPFVRPGAGRVVAWKGPRLEEEREAGRAACRALGGEPGEEIAYAPPGFGAPSGEKSGLRLVTFEKQTPCPARYPRDAGVIRKRPLGGETRSERAENSPATPARGPQKRPPDAPPSKK